MAGGVPVTVVDNPPITDHQIELRIARLPVFYSYKDVLVDVCGDDEDLFLDCYCDGRFGPVVRRVIVDTMGPDLLTVWLLRRQVRLQTTLMDWLTRE